MYVKIVICDGDQACLEQIKELLYTYGKEKGIGIQLEAYPSDEELLTKKDRIFVINTKEGLVNVNYSEILYVENVARRMCVTLKDGNVYQSIGIRDSFDKKIKCLLEEGNFIQPHKSYVVNLDYVSRCTPVMLHMDNDIEIPVSRRNSIEVKKRYLEYIALKCSG